MGIVEFVAASIGLVLISSNFILTAGVYVRVGRLIEKTEDHERRIGNLETGRRPYVEAL